MTAGECVVVVGAGVAGLTTAVVLAEAGASVHVIAEQVPGVTSLAAGAMWGPYLVEPKDKVDQWGQRSLEIFRELAEDATTGVRLTSGIEASRTAEAAPDWAMTLPGFRPCEPAELPAGFTAGYRFTVPLIDMPTYLDYLMRRLHDAGGAIERRRLTSLSDARPASAIVNCAGLGARDLVPDPALRPIRGQHVVVTNPGLTEFFSEDTGLSPDLLCFYPHGDTVVLGGTAIDGEGDLAPDGKAAAGILARCAEVEPRLAAARVLEHRIGARPTRATIRVESVRWQDGTVVVHNYGHGGAGVTLSWGCAEETRTLLATQVTRPHGGTDVVPEQPGVAAAVIVHGGRVLLVRRRVSEGSLSWQFPGGKVEPGETREDAAVRETQEEIGLAVAAVKMLGERVHPETGRLMSYVACDVVSGTAHIAAPDELAELAWATRGEIPQYVPAGLFEPVRDYLDGALPS